MKIHWMIVAIMLSGCAVEHTAFQGMEEAPKKIQAVREYAIKPGFSFETEYPVLVKAPRIADQDDFISRGEKKYYSEHLQKKLSEMFKDLGFTLADPAGSRPGPMLVFETTVLKIRFGDDSSRRHSGLVGALLSPPDVQVQIDVYLEEAGSQNKVAGFYETVHKFGGAFINNLSAQELVLASFDVVVDERLKPAIQKIQSAT